MFIVNHKNDSALKTGIITLCFLASWGVWEGLWQTETEQAVGRRILSAVSSAIFVGIVLYMFLGTHENDTARKTGITTLCILALCVAARVLQKVADYRRE
jgi:peptidoglycan/LPS O-acetylase OafA/YrhL